MEKHHVELPDEIVGIVRCGNPKCITNNEPMRTRFTVAHDRNSLTLRCNYCCKEVRAPMCNSAETGDETDLEARDDDISVA